MVPWVLGLGGIEHLTVPWVLGLGAEWHRASHGPVGPGSGCWVAGLSAWGLTVCCPGSTCRTLLRASFRRVWVVGRIQFLGLKD